MYHTHGGFRLGGVSTADVPLGSPRGLKQCSHYIRPSDFLQSQVFAPVGPPSWGRGGLHFPARTLASGASCPRWVGGEGWIQAPVCSGQFPQSGQPRDRTPEPSGSGGTQRPVQLTSEPWMSAAFSYQAQAKWGGRQAQSCLERVGCHRTPPARAQTLSEASVVRPPAPAWPSGTDRRQPDVRSGCARMGPKSRPSQ